MLVRLNQWTAVLIAADTFIRNLVRITKCDRLRDSLSTAASMITGVLVCCAAVCVESRLDACRLDREAAGWTEEKGYPEGYVRPRERK